MELVTIMIETGNAAFEDQPATELARILRTIADKLEQGADPSQMQPRDVNGNRCGTLTIA